MGDRITASNDTLMRQAKLTAADYLEAGVEAVDRQFGVGGAATYPQLVAAYMMTAALDYGAGVIARAVEAPSDTDG